MTFDEWWTNERDLDYDLHGKSAAQEAWEEQQVRIDQLEADVKFWQGMADGYKVQLEEKRAENKALREREEKLSSSLMLATQVLEVIHSKYRLTDPTNTLLKEMRELLSESE